MSCTKIKMEKSQPLTVQILPGGRVTVSPLFSVRAVTHLTTSLVLRSPADHPN